MVLYDKAVWNTPTGDSLTPTDTATTTTLYFRIEGDPVTGKTGKELAEPITTFVSTYNPREVHVFALVPASITLDSQTITAGSGQALDGGTYVGPAMTPDPLPLPTVILIVILSVGFVGGAILVYMKKTHRI